jgi:hypothetical protein
VKRDRSSKSVRATEDRNVHIGGGRSWSKPDSALQAAASPNALIGIDSGRFVATTVVADLPFRRYFHWAWSI